YLTPLALLGVALSVLARRALLSLVAVMVVVLTVAVQAPWYYFGGPADVSEHATIRVLSSNLRKGQANPSAFVALASESADVITVSELTPEAVAGFSRAGIDQVFPYSVLLPGAEAEGIGLWSRFPLTDATPAKNRRTDIAAARLQVPGVKLHPLIASMHLVSPLAADADSFEAWRSGIRGAKWALNDFARTTAPAAVIVAGDFNSTPDMRQFRNLVTNGYRDSVEQTGSGFAPTFPAHGWSPPLITIDHVLTRNASAMSSNTVTLPGSDHRSLLATVYVPLEPATS
ncbi:MAG: endonuclease/exonuclease/phosphatase family protein, partial [Mycobacterium sp.]